MVPAGVVLEISDRCEMSDPYSLDDATVLQTIDNTNGINAQCFNVSSTDARALARTFRVRSPSAATKCVEQNDNCQKDLSTSLPIYKAMTVSYGEVSREGIIPTFLHRPAQRRELSEGNYPVTLLVGTKSSGTTMVEFILKVGNGEVTEQVMAEILTSQAGKSDLVIERTMKRLADDNPGIVLGTTAKNAVEIPTNFPFKTGWLLTQQLSTQGLVFFQTTDATGDMFGGVSPPTTINYPADGMGDTSIIARGVLAWTPCDGDAGMYYYCMTAVSTPLQDDSSASYRWADTQCLRMRVAEDIPPKMYMYYNDNPFQDKDTYDVFMGQTLEAVVNASDNFQDSIDFVKISKIKINTGDDLRASVAFVYENVDKAYKDVTLSKMPKFVEPAVPSFVNLYLGGPRNATIAKLRRYQKDQVISYTPTRMHSGLEFAVCFMAVDDRGHCSLLGHWAERCMRIMVHRCKYSMQVGETMTNLAGLFQQNWIQLYVLNPTFSTPEAALVNNETVIHVGHLYEVREGEDVFSILKKFGMSKKTFMFMNVDFSRQTEESWAATLPVGAQLCIVPNSCGAI